MTTGTATLRYGVIGTGTMGRHHIEAIRNIPEITIAAIADPCRDSRTEALKLLSRDVPAWEDYRQLLDANDLDAVIVATPNDTHADIICDALQAGRHVLCEKPMAATIEGCGRVLTAARQASHVYQVGLELRHAPVFQRVHRLIAEGKIGKVRQLWCKEFRGPWQLKVDQWITQKHKSGGAVYYEHLAFAEALRHERRPLTDATVGWWATAVALAGERAIAEKRIVSLQEFDGPPT